MKLGWVRLLRLRNGRLTIELSPGLVENVSTAGGMSVRNHHEDHEEHEDGIRRSF